MNKGKCQLKIAGSYRTEALVFTCKNPDHDHGEPHWLHKRWNRDSVVVDKQSLYSTMVKKSA